MWGTLAAIATLVLMIVTEPGLAIAWDEGYTLGRVGRVRLWFEALVDPTAFAASWSPPDEPLVQPDSPRAPRLSPPAASEIDSRTKLFHGCPLRWFWPFGREEPHGHPPFYGIVALLGDLLTPWRPPLERARLGTMLAFSLTAGAIVGALWRRRGPWAAAVGGGAWVLQPNLFGLGHYATYDGLLSALWIGAILAFQLAIEDRPNGEAAAASRRPHWFWVMVFGVLLGWAADTKLTGWFLPLPFVAWSLLYRSRRASIALAFGIPIAAIAFLVFNPPIWSNPVEGINRFLDSNLTRPATIRLPVLFLGRVVQSPVESLPWYNTLLWTVLVTPAGFLLLAVYRLIDSARHRAPDPFGVLVLAHWVFLLSLRALPHTPGHDGVRQFLPAFGCLALMAGLGAESLVFRLPRWGRRACAASLVEAAVGLALIWPVPLSYFSPLVGGLRGAYALGMEPTYYWDACTDETLDWLNTHTEPGRTVQFCSFPRSWYYLRQTGRLRASIQRYEPADESERTQVAWYVLQNRPGLFSSRDRSLLECGRPSFTFSKAGVPLLLIYPYAEVIRCEGIEQGNSSTASQSDSFDGV